MMVETLMIGYFNPLPRKEGDLSGSTSICTESIFQSTPS